MSLSKDLNQAWEDRRRHAEWEDRFVTYGYILLQALEKVAKNHQNPDAVLAQDALDKFNDKVKKL